MKKKLFSALQTGYDALEARRDMAEAGKDSLRGGNSGCFVGEGKIAGCDPRVSVLRYFGVETKEGYSKQLMFDAGLTNEDSITAQLLASNTAFKREEECPVAWEAGGMAVTGRPDVKVGRLDLLDGSTLHGFIDEYGIELKLFCSVYSVIKHAHFAGGVPKTDHIIQSAHYSWQNNYLPWVLLYTSRVNWAVPYYATKPSQKKPEGYFCDPTHPALGYDDSGRPYRIEPFLSAYDLTWKEDRLIVGEHETAVTGEGVRQYYEYVAKCIQERIVPETNSLYDFMGNKIPDDKNDNIRYYDFKEADESKGFDYWLANCKEITEGGLNG